MLFADCGVTKGMLIDYYEAVAEHFVRHATDRPLTMQRFPDGIDKSGFFQKQIGSYFPAWIKRAHISTEGGHQEQVICNNQATLAYLANQACVTSHLFSSRIDQVDKPDRLIIDLDPYDNDFDTVRRAAGQCKALLEELKLISFVKTTGSRGLHVVVPIRREREFDYVREFSRALAEHLAFRHRNSLTTEQRKNKRRGRLFLDVGRNAYGQTAVAPYSIRALPGAPVAAPIRWAELEDQSLHARSFTMKNITRRLERTGDPWQSMGRSARSLTAARQRFDLLASSEF
jgi:bifunctional non-homologous end joining protein LigD